MSCSPIMQQDGSDSVAVLCHKHRKQGSVTNWLNNAYRMAYVTDRYPGCERHDSWLSSLCHAHPLSHLTYWYSHCNPSLLSQHQHRDELSACSLNSCSLSHSVSRRKPASLHTFIYTQTHYICRTLCLWCSLDLPPSPSGLVCWFLLVMFLGAEHWKSFLPAEQWWWFLCVPLGESLTCVHTLWFLL